jgi:NAD(P)-dependent dehydrogenase (short-subunit alcohol dehydrogenase family)
MGKFKDKSALISGCSRDVRLEIITRLTAEGASVFVPADLDHPFHTSDPPLDILILGGAEPNVTFEDLGLALEQSEFIFRTNVVVPISVIRRALGRLSDRTSIVIVTSDITPEVSSHKEVYDDTDVILRSYARMLYHNLKKRGIRVNTVSQRPVERRALIAEVNGHVQELPVTIVPAKSLNSHVTVAKAIVSLFCDERSDLTGTELTIEDGLMQITPLTKGARHAGVKASEIADAVVFLAAAESDPITGMNLSVGYGLSEL